MTNHCDANKCPSLENFYHFYVECDPSRMEKLTFPAKIEFLVYQFKKMCFDKSCDAVAQSSHKDHESSAVKNYYRQRLGDEFGLKNTDLSKENTSFVSLGQIYDGEKQIREHFNRNFTPEALVDHLFDYIRTKTAEGQSGSISGRHAARRGEFERGQAGGLSVDYNGFNKWLEDHYEVNNEIREVEVDDEYNISKPIITLYLLDEGIFIPKDKGDA